MSLFGDTTPGAVFDQAGKQVGTMPTEEAVTVDQNPAPTDPPIDISAATPPPATPPPTNEPAAAAPTEIDWTTHLSEKTGGKFSTWEELTAKLNEAQSAPSITYSNDESRQVAELLQAGKVDEVLQIYNTQRVLSSVKDMSDADVIKLASSFKNTAFDENDINEDFAARYQSLEKPEKPDKDEYVDEDDYNKALKVYNKEVAQYDKAEKALARQLKAEAAESRAYLKSLEKEISLPTIQPQAAPETNALNPEMEKKARELYLSSVTKSSSDFKEIPFEINEDGFTFKGNFQVDDADRAKLTKALNGDNVIEDQFISRYVSGDSLDNIQYNTSQMMKDLYVLNNFDRILKSAIKQAVAADRLEQAKNLKNVDLGASGGTGSYVADDKAAYKEFAAKVFAMG